VYDKTVIDDPDYDGWTPLARPGDLSPFTRTGVLLSSKWPNKPDVVFEGGNVAHDGQAFDDGVPDLCPLSTFFRPYDRLFVLSNAIRAATAQVARIAVLAMVDLPSLWPETMTGPPRGAGEI